MQELLKAEGAHFHDALCARAMTDMGGGMGITTTQSLPAGSTLIDMPACSIITTRKARFNLALIEVELRNRLARCGRASNTEHASSRVLTDDVDCASSSPDVRPSCSRVCDTREIKQGNCYTTVLPLTAHVWSKEEEHRVLGPARRTAVKSMERRLKCELDPSETIACYLIVLASLYNRRLSAAHTCSERSDASGCVHDTVTSLCADTVASWPDAGVAATRHVCEPDSGAVPAVGPVHSNWAESPNAASSHAPGIANTDPLAIHFTHENAWMALWIRALPPGCDNLLELMAHRCGAPSACPLDETALLRHLAFARHRDKVRQEMHELAARHERCVGVLRCLSELPCGVWHPCSPTRAPHCSEKGPTSIDSVATSGGANTNQADKDDDDDNDRDDAEAEVSANDGTPRYACEGDTHATTPVTRPWGCTREEFLWAWNMLMSRGFAFDEDVWAMMPLVDYFNYELDANCTMHTHAPHSEATRSKTKGCSGPGGVCLSGASLHNRSGTRELGYRFTTRLPVQSGEQLFVSYGAYTDFELLLWYGFTLRSVLLPSPMDGARTQLDVLSQLSRPCSRRRLYDSLHARDAPSATLTQASDCLSNVEVSEDEGNYEDWCVALQRCFGYEFAPLASSDGVYAGVGETGATWIDELVGRFVARQAALHVGEQCHDDCGGTESHYTSLHTAADEGATRVAHAWRGCRAQCDMSDIHTHAVLGCLGPSANMKECLRRLCRVHASAVQGSTTYTAALREKLAHAQTSHCAVRECDIVRAIAWMELRSNDFSLFSTDSHAEDRAYRAMRRTMSAPLLPPHTIACTSAVCRAATQMSDDAFTLLYYLAIDASDEALENYISCESYY